MSGASAAQFSVTLARLFALSVLTVFRGSTEQARSSSDTRHERLKAMLKTGS